MTGAGKSRCVSWVGVVSPEPDTDSLNELGLSGIPSGRLLSRIPLVASSHLCPASDLSGRLA
jgi:hypothetical protein